ncbi:hypothetical protein PM082_022288 [Marasmius tenuissimus]|nr:hypothetical protein PM082_022288 [Marasmius tenuissimus]
MNPHILDNATQASVLSEQSPFNDATRLEVPSVINAGTCWTTEIDTDALSTCDLAAPPPIETLNDFRKREAENLVKIARRLIKLNDSWESERESLVEQAERHGCLIEEGFTQVKEMQKQLDSLSRQPVPALPHEKLNYLFSAAQSSLTRISALEQSISRLQKEKISGSHTPSPHSYYTHPQTPSSKPTTIPNHPKPPSYSQSYPLRANPSAGHSPADSQSSYSAASQGYQVPRGSATCAPSCDLPSYTWPFTPQGHSPRPPHPSTFGSTSARPYGSYSSPEGRWSCGDSSPRTR